MKVEVYLKLQKIRTRACPQAHAVEAVSPHRVTAAALAEPSLEPYVKRIAARVKASAGTG